MSEPNDAKGAASQACCDQFQETIMKTEKCPVCDWELKGDAKKVKVKDRTVTVCCDECAEKVKANPGKYLAKK